MDQWSPVGLISPRACLSKPSRSPSGTWTVDYSSPYIPRVAQDLSDKNCSLNACEMNLWKNESSKPNYMTSINRANSPPQVPSYIAVGQDSSCSWKSQKKKLIQFSVPEQLLKALSKLPLIRPLSASALVQHWASSAWPARVLRQRNKEGGGEGRELCWYLNRFKKHGRTKVRSNSKEVFSHSEL